MSKIIVRTVEGVIRSFIFHSLEQIIGSVDSHYTNPDMKELTYKVPKGHTLVDVEMTADASSLERSIRFVVSKDI